MKPRQPRQKVLIRARLKGPDGWHDACIVDLSRRGAGLQVATAPPRGSYVEISRGAYHIVARVMWSRGHRFGVSAQDDIPVDLIAAERAPANRHAERRAKVDRRAVAGIAAAMVAGAEVRNALAAPLVEIGAVLDR